MVALLLSVFGCGRPDEAACASACSHAEQVLGKKLARCVEECRAHGSRARAECLSAASTAADIEDCRAH